MTTSKGRLRNRLPLKSVVEQKLQFTGHPRDVWMMRTTQEARFKKGDVINAFKPSVPGGRSANTLLRRLTYLCGDWIRWILKGLFFLVDNEFI
jgi:hypothetical protein